VWAVREGVLGLAASVRARQVTVEPGGVLDAGGVVDGAVENAGTVTGESLTVHGSYTQRPGGRLTARRLTVSGPVALAGTFEPGPGGIVIDNAGTDAVTGTFDGLPEGTEVGGHRISYQGGDGNDVVLTDPEAPGDPGVAPLAAPTGGNGLVWSVVAGVVVLLCVILLFLIRRGRHRMIPPGE
jgi:LPXTG-motif cell wall-anchored protein